jgi:hypothetical protein
MIPGSLSKPPLSATQPRLDTVIAQVRSALERLSSPDALEEIRGAIREYRDSEKRHMLAGWRRRS